MPPGWPLLPRLGMMLDLQVWIVFRSQAVTVGPSGAADHQCSQLPFGAPVQLVDFEFNELPFPRPGIPRAGRLPLGDVKKDVLAVIFGFDKAKFTALVHVPDATEPPTRDDERLLVLRHIS